MGFVKKGNAQIFLFINALLWGSSYIWSKMLLSYLPRFSILFVCSVGGLLTTAAMFYPYIKSITRNTVFISVAISGISVLSNTFCMLALQNTSSSNTAFIVQMSVVITPMIMALMEKRIPGMKIVISSITALFGIFLLTCDMSSFRFNIGDIFALCNAFCFSLFVACLNRSSNKVNPVHFTFIHHATNSAAFLILAFIFESKSINFHVLSNYEFIALIVVNSIVVILTTLLQSTALKYVRPERATLIYTFEPVTAAILAFALLGEELNGLKSVAGCLIILVSLLVPTFKLRLRRKKIYDAEKILKKLLAE